MKNVRLLLLLGLLVFPGAFPVDVNAQPAPKPELPEGPLLREMGPREAWAIEFRSSKSPAENREGSTKGGAGEPKPATLQRVSFTVVKPRWQMTASRARPIGQIEFWSDGIELYSKDSTSKSPPIQSTVGALQQDPENSPDVAIEIAGSIQANKFPGFEWISEANYAGKVALNGVPCLAFKNKDITAWVDEKNRQPVLWEKAGEIRAFKMETAPSKIEFPADIAARMEILRKRNEALTRKPPRGG